MTSFHFVLFMVINLQDIAYQYNNAGGGGGRMGDVFWRQATFQTEVLNTL